MGEGAVRGWVEAGVGGLCVLGEYRSWRGVEEEPRDELGGAAVRGRVRCCGHRGVVGRGEDRELLAVLELDRDFKAVQEGDNRGRSSEKVGLGERIILRRHVLEIREAVKVVVLAMVEDGEGDRGEGGLVVHSLVERHVLDGAFDRAQGLVFKGCLISRDLGGERVVGCRHLDCEQWRGGESGCQLCVVVGWGW